MAQKLQFYRNSTVASSKAAAYTTLEGKLKSSEYTGEPIICTYYTDDTSSSIDVLFGITAGHITEDGDNNYTIFDFEGLKSNLDALSTKLKDYTVNEDGDISIKFTEGEGDTLKERELVLSEGGFSLTYTDGTGTEQLQHTVVLDNDGLFYDNEEVATQGDIESLVVNEDGSVSIVATMTEEGQEKDYTLTVSNDGVSYGEEKLVTKSTLDTIIDAVGLDKTDSNYGKYVAPENSNYLSTSDSVKNALSKLDAKLKTASDGVDGMAADVAYDDYKIFLTDSDGEKIGNGFDASAFVKDGMLLGEAIVVGDGTPSQEVEIKGQTHAFEDLEEGKTYLVLCFKTEQVTTTTTEGENPTTTSALTTEYSWDKLDVDTLVDVYTEGNGIKVENNEISIKLATDDETQSFLSVTENGLALSGIFDIEDVVTKTFNEIKTSVGLDENAHYNAPTTATYIKDAESVSEALSILDTSISAISLDCGEY